MRHYHFISLVIPFLFSSCFVFHSGGISSGSPLNSAVTYVDVAKGNSKSVFVLGLGSLKQSNDLVIKAQEDMYRNRPLKKDEFYSNFATSITNKYIFLIINVVHASVRADVLKLQEHTAEPVRSFLPKNTERKFGL